MGDPRAFLTIGRKSTPRRPREDRVHDYNDVYERLPEADLRQQAARCMDCGIPFCNTGCPLGNLIPEWNDLVHLDQWHTAIDRLHATNNFPEFTGQLCPAPCEDACVLSINDNPVAIKDVERSIIERAFDEGWVVPHIPESRTGREVAVVGSGPAGLAAAQQLNRAGHTVTVFEKSDRIGGLLVYGIPDFKIEKWVVDRRVKQLEDEGIEFRTSTNAGVSPTFEELKAGFDAVLLAVGAQAGRDVPVPGRELDGIHLAMDYLTQQNRRVAGLPVDEPTITAHNKRVVIIGGGDTGADCLGNAHREKCIEVDVLTRGQRPPDEAGAIDWPHVPLVLRTWPAHEEGGGRHFDLVITAFSGENGKVSGVTVAEAARDETGMVVGRAGTEQTIPAELVLLATGFVGPVQDLLLQQVGLSYTRSGAIAADSAFCTGDAKVFVTGDAKLGASLIVTVIADGRKAARAIDESLMGASSLPG